jgi:hypothetical protein
VQCLCCPFGAAAGTGAGCPGGFPSVEGLSLLFGVKNGHTFSRMTSTLKAKVLNSYVFFGVNEHDKDPSRNPLISAHAVIFLIACQSTIYTM